MVCRFCGGPLPKGCHRGKKYCSKQCSNFQKINDGRLRRNGNLKLLRFPIGLETCDHCSTQFKPKKSIYKKYCSRNCYFAVKAEKKILQEFLKSCFVSVKVFIYTCSECGSTGNRSDVKRKLCKSEKCEKARRSRKASEKAQKKFKSTTFACAECGLEAETKYGKKSFSKYCCKKCADKSQRRTAKQKRRARLKQARIETVDSNLVFARDSWRCQICLTKTPKEKRGLGVCNSPELDHIVPLSKGGDHSYANTQCLCRRCNGKKSNTVLGQLNLFPNCA